MNTDERAPLFSIVIPCYKVETYIRDCLDSLLIQECRDWEALCVDDGSPDDTGRILDAYAKQDDRIKVIHQANGGLSAARNAAIVRAKGDWLVYLDGDDVLSPCALKTYSELSDRHRDADLIKGGICYFDDGKSVQWKDGPSAEFAVDVSGEIIKDCQSGYFPQTIYRRSAFGDVLFSGLSWCEERPYVAKCMSYAKSLAVTSVPCYGFRRRAGSITHRPMTFAEWSGYLDATREVIRTYCQSGKKLYPGLVRGLINIWIEEQLAKMYEFLPRELHRQAWRVWFSSLAEVPKVEGATTWQRFVACVCRSVPLRPLAILLCYLPHCLKVRGVHR